MSKLLIILIFCLSFTSCRITLDINDFIDTNSEFILIIVDVDSDTGLSTFKTEDIKVNSKKWVLIIEFLKNNIDSWRSSPASHIGNIYVKQNSFSLTYSKGFNSIVLKYIDKEGQPKQYYKSIDKKELDFLTELN